jgi:hypothetical protein
LSGYKGRLDPLALDEDLRTGDWIRVAYKENRGIFHDGDLFHLSCAVESMGSGKRVIMGFNSFTDAVGPCCLRAPEHSKAFNRTVKLYQALASTEKTASSSSSDGRYTSSCRLIAPAEQKAIAGPASRSGGKFSAKDILKNPALAKLLVAAAKRLKDANELIEVVKGEGNYDRQQR